MLLVYVTFPQEGHLRDAPDATQAAPERPCGLEAVRRLARELVEARLAAGINILPGALSVYRWQENIHEAAELVLLAQVSRAAFADFRAHVLARHPHDVPCITALPIADGNAAFLRWIEENSLPLRHGISHPQPL
ncbi:divalent-cation tolerance protein CutA [uncultured Desulfovibrio sp.]|uniref:divalent-cation tolerance protein CutA n=1 Tax=uncultured Desulfovibrio sp. TaxID=167968 RepID=UPI00261711F9|nr:divalent-cation tolerance protein CutA [uncultured Desulfovibrio sp.]